MDSKDIKTVLSLIAEVRDIENKNLFEKIIETYAPNRSFKDAEEFEFAVWLPYEEFTEQLIKLNFQDSLNEYSNIDDLVFLYQHGSYFKSHFCKLFEQYEGFSCSADKARTILRALESFFIIGKEIQFDYSGEYTYHLPKKILSNHKEILDFYYGLTYLYFGNPVKYIEEWAKLAGIQKD